MNSNGDGKPEPVDPENVVRMLELELMQKRAARQMAGRRFGGLRAASFLFLFAVIVGALLAFYYVFYSGGLDALRARTGAQPTPERDGKFSHSVMAEATMARLILRLVMPLADHLMDQEELLEFAHDAVILTDGHGTITYWNRGASRTYGWDKEDALGQNVHALLRTELSGDAGNLESILERDAHWEGELVQVRRDGRQIRVASRWTMAGENSASARLQINRDITARHEEESALRESEKRYRRFVTEDFTGNLSIRPDGQIVTCNPAFANIFGFDSMDEAIAGNFLELLRSRKDGVELLEMVRQTWNRRAARARNESAGWRPRLRGGPAGRALLWRAS